MKQNNWFSRENYAIVHLFFSEVEVTAYELNEINDYVGFLSKQAKKALSSGELN